jgi:hypothetical protein
LHAPLRELLHHFEEFLAIVLQEIIGNGQDVAWAYKWKDVNKSSDSDKSWERRVGQGGNMTMTTQIIG